MSPLTNSARETSTALEARKVEYVPGQGEGQTLSVPVAPGLKSTRATQCVLELVLQSKRLLYQKNTGTDRACWDTGDLECQNVLLKHEASSARSVTAGIRSREVQL